MSDHSFEPVCVTADSVFNDQLLYFTSSSLSEDDRWLIFISDRSGQPNLFALDQLNGEVRQLTDNAEGYLKSYVYFDGIPNRGLGKASVSLHAPSGTVYYIQGDEIRAVGLDGQMRVLARVPAGQVTAFTHVSQDGTRLVVPTTDARALEAERLVKGRPDYDIDERVQREGLVSTLHVYDTRSGAQLLGERVARAWITHVQFCPTDNDLILYNHEWPGDCGIRRVWLFNARSGEHTRMRSEGAGRSKADWVCHEVWDKDGQTIVYHGGFNDGAYFVGKVARDGSRRVEIGFPPEYRKYGHFNLNHAGLLVGDGYYQESEVQTQPGLRDEWRGGEWISLQSMDWERGAMVWQPLCKHGSTWENQDCHPHPIFNHAGTAVYFTSNVSGRRAIYRIDLAPWS
jgi:oligogalacturonide lyase